MKVLELFSGIRATSEALNRLNVEHETFTVEFNEKFQNVANKLWGTDEPARDVTQFTAEWLPEHWNKKADLVVGGFPCQPFSMAGKQQGFHDEKGRGKLYQDTLRVINEVQPTYVILENVKSILNKNHKWIITEIEETLKEWGYYVHTQVINSKNYLPQNRERVFVMASKIRQPEHIEEKSHDMILRDFLEEDKEVSLNYFITNQQISNLNLDLDKLDVKDAKKIIKVGNCSASNHSGLNVYSVKGISPTFRENHGASIKIVYSNKEYTNTERLEALFNHKFKEPHNGESIIDIIAEAFGTTDLVVEKDGEKHFKLSDGTTRKIGYREAEKNWLLPISKNYTNNIVKDIDGVLSTLTSSSPKKIILLEKWLMENRVNINGIFHKSFNAENYVTGAGTEEERAQEGSSHHIGTLTSTGANSKQKIIESLIPLKIRAITPREAFRLMGWYDHQIDNIIDSCPKTDIYKTAGNSMVIHVMQDIVANLLGE